MEKDVTIDLRDRRFLRFEAIEWWDQALLADAKVLVVGAGALGNEVLKNLALLGLGHLAIVDFDSVEESNLTRSVLFRSAHRGLPKAQCAAEGVRELYPDLHAVPLVADLVGDVGLGWIRWADVVVGAVDNREARVFVNKACALTRTPWFDGGLDVLSGVVRGFHPPQTACYECTMSEADWDLLHHRRSCSLLGQRAAENAGTPTTPTVAAVIGGIQAQEVVKYLHGVESLLGKGYVFEGSNHSSYPVDYAASPTCDWHETPCDIVTAAGLCRDTPVHALWEEAGRIVPGVEAIDLSRDVLKSVRCPECDSSTHVMRALGRRTRGMAVCPSCGTECVPSFFHSLYVENARDDATLAQTGIPSWDVVWARSGDAMVGIEIGGDAENELARGSEGM